MLKTCNRCYCWDQRDIVKKIGICTVSMEVTIGETLCLHDKQEEEENEQV